MNKNRSLWEWFIILPLKNGKYIIKSYKDGMTMYLSHIQMHVYSSKNQTMGVSSGILNIKMAITSLLVKLQAT
jgi:hypothetical protein